MESWNATLKCELGEGFDSLGDAQRRLFDYIEVFYTQTRIHSANGHSSPAAFDSASGFLVSTVTPPDGTTGEAIQQ